MKLTKSKLKQIIKEELGRFYESEDATAWEVEWFPPTSDRRASVKVGSYEEALSFIEAENLAGAEDLTVYSPDGEEVELEE